MQCLGDQDSTCGGTADRLKLFPFVVRLAYDSQRILLIHWTMPARLESWLVPPKGGLDWRAPTWMESIVSSI
jgi:hypothetical protein